jgi:hypothetical protein
LEQIKLKEMKKNILFTLLILAVVAMFNSCTTPPIEVAQEAYDYNAIVPKVLGGVKGPAIAIQTFTADYTIGYYRGGSTWNWTATDATVKSVSADTRVATIEFKQYPASGKAKVSVTETTMGGKTSEPVSFDVTVKKYCPLPNGIAGLVGSWTGTDGQGADYTFDSQITTVVSGTKLAVTGMSVGFITEFWGEAIIDGGTFMMTWNVDGTVDIPRQYIYTTEYEGDPYDYEIKGSGTWDNCGSAPKLLINYDIYYTGEADGLAKQYASYLDGIAYLTANIELDGTKSAQIFTHSTPLTKVVKR